MLHKKYFYICFTVLWICFIFSFSLRDGEVSNAMSNKVGQAIIENFDAKFEVIKKGVFLYGKIYVDTIEEMTIQKTFL